MRIIHRQRPALARRGIAFADTLPSRSSSLPEPCRSDETVTSESHDPRTIDCVTTLRPDPLICRSSMACVATIALLALSGEARGAHPYITDDTNTQGTGHFELQLGAQYTRSTDSGLTTADFAFQPQLTSGLLDPLDLIIRPGYSVLVYSGASSGRAAGFGDTDIALKWRFWENAAWSVAVVAGSGVPSGNGDRGLGSTRSTPHVTLIGGYASPEVQAWANASVARTGDASNERSTVAHVSANVQALIREGLQVGFDLGVDQNSAGLSPHWTSVLLFGAIWTLTPACDVDAGYQRALTNAVPTNQWLLGVTLRW